ncbi:hypothetical protein SLE2022_176670 [Rubroshorea leprosula]
MMVQASGGNLQCINFVSPDMVNEWTKFVPLILMYVLSRIAHHILRPLSQPYITSDIIIGLCMGALQLVRKSLGDQIILILENIADFGMICYMFVLGLEMDPFVIFKPPTRDAMLAYAGMLTTLILACAITPWLHYSLDPDIIRFTLCLAVSLSGNGSHVLTRLITNLKIGKSDIGKLGIGAAVHSDMVTMLLLSIGFVLFPPGYLTTTPQERLKDTIKMGSALMIQTILAAKLSPIFMNWVNNENPEGKTLKGSHLVLSMAFMVMICSCAPWYGYSPFMSAFMAGLFLPSEGRISKWAISKINYTLTILFYPLFFLWIGCRLDLGAFKGLKPITWANFFILLLITTLGKVVGTVICGIMLGFHWPELISLGLLLTAKGHFHVYFGVYAFRKQSIDNTTSLSMLFVVFLSVVQIPFLVNCIIERARQRVPIHRMALQWLEPTSELRILLCFHGPHNVPSLINFTEISKGRPNPGIVVYVTDMIELTDEIAATLVRNNEGAKTPTVTDKSVTELRDQVTHMFQSYVDENGEGITLRRMLALSTFNDMAQDISALAEDLMVCLIILPFHKNMNADGTLDGGHPGFRYVNRKLLRNAKCSIGILVDRGFGSVQKISKASPLMVAVIFIGGKDDREALTYAGRVAWHPGVKLTVIRFLVDKNSENAPRRVNRRASVAEQEEEMKLDDESFALFYERYIAGGNVAYTEKHLANSSETFNTLRSLQEQEYSLIIVGQGGRVNTVLTMGLNDWQQCPELGPVGDVLSGSGISSKTSILIIQQQSLKGQLDGLSDEFSIM